MALLSPNPWLLWYQNLGSLFPNAFPFSSHILSRHHLPQGNTPGSSIFSCSLCTLQVHIFFPLCYYSYTNKLFCFKYALEGMEQQLDVVFVCFFKISSETVFVSMYLQFYNNEN